MMRIAKYTQAGGLLAALLLAGGCGSSLKQHSASNELSAIKSSSGNDSEWGVPQSLLEPRTIGELISLGHVVAEKSAHGDAGRIFCDAAEASASEGKLRQACLGAAALEFILAGDYTAWKATMVLMRAEGGRYGLLDPGPEVEVLLALDTLGENDQVVVVLDQLARRAGAREKARK